MKLRGKSNSVVNIQHFTKVIGTLERLISHEATMRITPNNIYFIFRETVTNGLIYIWCEIKKDHFFEEYNMEGLSDEYNEIYLTVTPENIMRALKSAQSAKSLKMKLTRKSGATLTFEVELPSRASRARLVVHDVPVKIIPRRRWDEFEEPAMPNYHVSIILPPLKTLKNVIDRMKALGSFLTISASSSGELILEMKEEKLVSVTTKFNDLENPVEDGDSQNDSRSQEIAEVRVDVKKVAQLLSSQQMTPTNIICNILNRRMIHFFVVYDSVSLQYLLPAINN